MEIPVVITATRYEQPITKAPVTITVITAQEIGQSGATNIPDLLRMVPGVDVMAITARDQQVSVRGLNMPMSNKLLVMVDGISVYWEAYGFVLWDMFPIGLEEIKQIEIVRGPGSSLYGANAYCGVINIITKSPDEIDGTQINLTGGNYNTFLTEILHSGTREKIDYKVSAKWDRTNEWANKSKKAGEATCGNALFRYNFSKRDKLIFSAGRTDAKDRKFLISEFFGQGEISGNFDYLHLNYDHSNLKLRTFLKREDVDAKWLTTGDKQRWLTQTIDTELLDRFNIGQRHSLVLGANYRRNTIKKNPYIPKDHYQDLWAIFGEDNLEITDKLNLTLGGRYDRHPLVKEHFSPRGALSYSPSNEHLFRFSAGKAFRNPAFLNSFFYSEKKEEIALPPPLPSVPVTYIFQGNEDLKSEGITSCEMAYRTNRLRNIVLNLNLFYNEYTDLFISATDITNYTDTELVAILGFLPPDLLPIPKECVSMHQNGIDGQGIGAEIGLDIYITHWLSAVLNYSYQEISTKNDNPYTKTINEEDRICPEFPKNKVNASLAMRLKKNIQVNLLAHWVDKTERLNADAQRNEYLAPTDAYTLFNISAKYTFLDQRAGLSLSVFNLFNDKHYEYPPGINLPDTTSDKIGRKLSAGVSYKF